MTRIVIECDDELAAHAEEAARREHKSVADWIKARMKSDYDRLKQMEECAAANGYPPGWLSLYGSLADDETFVAPTRTR
jgi:hypothetical protein